MRKEAAFLVLASLTYGSSIASQTACTFEGTRGTQYVELEFIGDTDIKPMIVFSSAALGAGKRITLRPADYTLKTFSQSMAAVHLEFRNPGDGELPPSFCLIGRRGQARLRMGTTTVRGSLKCDH